MQLHDENKAKFSPRRYDLDWLRVLAILTVFVFHSGRFFDLGDWHVKNATTYVGVQIWLSRTCRASGLGRSQEALAEQTKACTPIRLTFQQFQAGNMTLNRTGAPTFAQGGGNRRFVPFDPAGECFNSVTPLILQALNQGSSWSGCRSRIIVW